MLLRVAAGVGLPLQRHMQVCDSLGHQRKGLICCGVSSLFGYPFPLSSGVVQGAFQALSLLGFRRSVRDQQHSYRGGFPSFSCLTDRWCVFHSASRVRFHIVGSVHACSKACFCSHSLLMYRYQQRTEIRCLTPVRVSVERLVRSGMLTTGLQ